MSGRSDPPQPRVALPFFSVWLGGWTAGTCAMVADALQRLATDPWSSMPTPLMSAFFLGFAWVALDTVEKALRVERAKTRVSFAPRMDLGGVEATWRVAPSHPVHACWGGALLLLPPLALGAVPTLAFLDSPSWPGLLYGLPVAAAVLASWRPFYRHLRAELAARQRVTLTVRGADLEIDAPGVRRVWPLSGVRVERRGDALAFTDASSTVRVPLQGAPEVVDELLGWIGAASAHPERAPIPAPPAALRELARRAEREG